MKTPIQSEFDDHEGPGVAYPVVWYLVCVVAVAAVVAIVRWIP